MNLTGCSTCSISRPQRRQHIKGPEGSKEKSCRLRKEQEIGTRSRGSEHTASIDPQYQEVAKKGSRVLLFLILQARAMETNPLHQEEKRNPEAARQQQRKQVDKGEISVGTWRLVNGRPGVPAKNVQKFNSQGKDPSISTRKMQGKDN